MVQKNDSRKPRSLVNRSLQLLCKRMSLVSVLACISIPVGCQNRLKMGGENVEAPRTPPSAAAPVQAPSMSISFDLQEALRTPKSVLILAIGHAEGTINLDGSPTQAYYGHGDSGFHNVGVFSCISCGNRAPEEADVFYLENKIRPLRTRFEDAARGALLPANHPMLSAAFFTLLTQSPEAATDRKGFLERMASLKMLGITLENLVQVSVDSYRDPDSNRFEDVARFGNDESRIRADQKRRLSKVEAFLRNRGIELYPRY